jgi:hypothetical protein
MQEGGLLRYTTLIAVCIIFDLFCHGVLELGCCFLLKLLDLFVYRSYISLLFRSTHGQSLLHRS